MNSWDWIADGVKSTQLNKLIEILSFNFPKWTSWKSKPTASWILSIQSQRQTKSKEKSTIFLWSHNFPFQHFIRCVFVLSSSSQKTEQLPESL